MRKVYPQGVDAVLDLIWAPPTLADSLRCVGESGTVCMTGTVSNTWTFDSFTPMEVIPTALRLTT